MAFKVMAIRYCKTLPNYIVNGHGLYCFGCGLCIVMACIVMAIRCCKTLPNDAHDILVMAH